MKRPYLMASAMIVALAMTGCRVAQDGDNSTAPQASVEAADWPGFVNQFIEATFKANPGFAVGQGRHEYDGQVGDLSETGIAAEVSRLKKAIADAQAYGDDKLTPQQRYQRDYLVAVAKG